MKSFLSISKPTARGFTLMEILVVVAVGVVLTAIVGASLLRYSQRQSVIGTAVAVASALTDARSRTLSGQGALAYGVHFEDDLIVLFEGPTYSAGAASNESITVDPHAALSDISLAGGGDDVLFEKLTGRTANIGTITVSAFGDATLESTVTVEETGLVSYN